MITDRVLLIDGGLIVDTRFLIASRGVQKMSNCVTHKFNYNKLSYFTRYSENCV